jgi:hypothetical protein
VKHDDLLDKLKARSLGDLRRFFGCVLRDGALTDSTELKDMYRKFLAQQPQECPLMGQLQMMLMSEDRGEIRYDCLEYEVRGVFEDIGRFLTHGLADRLSFVEAKTPKCVTLLMQFKAKSEVKQISTFNLVDLMSGPSSSSDERTYELSLAIAYGVSKRWGRGQTLVYMRDEEGCWIELSWDGDEKTGFLLGKYVNEDDWWPTSTSIIYKSLLLFYEPQPEPAPTTGK